MALINKNNIKNCKVQKRENDYIDYMGIWAREMSEEFSHEINQRILEKMKEQAEMMIEKAKKYGEVQLQWYELAFINKDNLHKVSPNDRRIDELKDALAYFDRSDGPPIAIVYYLKKDELNRAQVWSRMIK